MDASAIYELNMIRSELQSIINELDSIAYEIKYQFKGIGNEMCANGISEVADKYRTVRRKLGNMDMNTVTDAFANTHGGGES